MRQPEQASGQTAPVLAYRAPVGFAQVVASRQLHLPVLQRIRAFPAGHLNDRTTQELAKIKGRDQVSITGEHDKGLKSGLLHQTETD